MLQVGHHQSTLSASSQQNQPFSPSSLSLQSTSPVQVLRTAVGDHEIGYCMTQAVPQLQLPQQPGMMYPTTGSPPGRGWRSVSDHSYSTVSSKRGRDFDDLDSSEDASSSLSSSITGHGGRSIVCRDLPETNLQVSCVSAVSISTIPTPIDSPATDFDHPKAFIASKKNRVNNYLAPRQVPNTVVSTVASLVGGPVSGSVGSIGRQHHHRRQLSGGQVEPFLSTSRTGNLVQSGSNALFHCSQPFAQHTMGSNMTTVSSVSNQMQPSSQASTQIGHSSSSYPQQQHSSDDNLTSMSMDIDDNGLYNPNRPRSMSF
jgi:hypothetical protein